MRIARRGFLVAVVLSASLVGLGSVHAEGAKPFIDAKVLDLTRFLPPPPANESEQTKAEIAQLLDVQAKRTPDQAGRAVADAVEDVWRFSETMGPAFIKEKLPRFAAFFERVVATEAAVVDPAKSVFKRLRPHMSDARVVPIVPKSSSGSWPSGHATVGTLMGIVLADMVPEKRTAIMARAREYADNRVIGGIHYASDIEMGRLAGTAIATELYHDTDFQREYAAAKAEVRAALGL